MHAYLVITKHEDGTPMDYFCFETKALVEASIRLSWHKVPEKMPKMEWDGNKGRAGDCIEVRFINVSNEVDHL